MKDYGEFVLEVEKALAVNIYLYNCANPPIPEGYKHVSGKWYSGFVIERDSDGSQFVWIPVDSLDPDGTLDGKHFLFKFGRRNYRRNEFSDSRYNEVLNEELLEQLISVKKYGGFYISRYNISKSSAGKPQSVKGVIPWIEITFNEANEIASTIENNETVKSHLPFGAEYDSVLAWFIKSRARYEWKITEDSSDWGNYSGKLLETGSCEKYCSNNIYDFAGNVSEWTQEQEGSSRRVIRGASYRGHGKYDNVSYRDGWGDNMILIDVGFRAALYIK